MADVILNRWPEEFKVDVQTPLVILRAQASYLGKVTRSILEGTVETESVRDRVQHRLVVVAPACGGYRHTLITALHNEDLPYPVEVRAEALAQGDPEEEYGVIYPKAYSDEEMGELVARTLQSQQTRAVILSLIAKSNEAEFVSPPSFPAGGAMPQESGPAA